ncbi:MAG: DUF637 domain-containing protein, partial [Magnetovibrio sp.]|nr:DUF637 domain-containing protein [Magnetovibrio sp.]
IAIVTGDGVIVDYKETKDLDTDINQLSQAPGLAWMKDLQGRNDVQWNAIKEIHKEWDYSSQGISPTGAIIISLAVAYATAGMGAELAGIVAEGSQTVVAAEVAVAGTVGTGSTIAVGTGTVTVASTSTVAMTNAGFTALVNQAATALVGNGGDIGAALKQIGSMGSLKSIATSVATAGMVASLDIGALNTPIGDATGAAKDGIIFANRLKTGIAEAVVSSTVESVINGEPLTENLKGALVNAAITAVSQSTFEKIGDIGIAKDLPEGGLQKIALHALAGCAIGQASSQNCMAGAMAAGMQEFAGDALKKINSDPTKQTQLAGLLGALAVTISGGDASAVSTAAAIGKTANAFNRQLHTAEIQAIKTKAEELASSDKGLGKSAAEWEEILGNAALRETDVRWAENLDTITDADVLATVNNAFEDMRTTHGAQFIADMGKTFEFLKRDDHYDNTTTFAMGLVADSAFYDNALQGWAKDTYGGALPETVTASDVALVEAMVTVDGSCGSGIGNCGFFDFFEDEIEILDPSVEKVKAALQFVSIREELQNTYNALFDEKVNVQAEYDTLISRQENGDTTVTQGMITTASTKLQSINQAVSQAQDANFNAWRTIPKVVDIGTKDAYTTAAVELIEQIEDLPETLQTTARDAARGLRVINAAIDGDENARDHIGETLQAAKELIQDIPEIPERLAVAYEAHLDQLDQLMAEGKYVEAGKLQGDLDVTFAAIVATTVGGSNFKKVTDAIKSNVRKTYAPDVPNASNLPGGVTSESGLLNGAENWLGDDYKSIDNNTFVSADGTRQFRFDANEPDQTGYFETLDQPGGVVTETTTVGIVPDQTWSIANNLEQTLPSVNLTQAEFLDIVNTKDKSRPDPSTYMSDADIDAHLSLFDEGAVRLTSKEIIDVKGTIGPSSGTFVMPKSEFDNLIIDTAGDLTLIEKRLGLSSGQLTSGETVAAYIAPSNMRNLRMASGNEDGANTQWIPGGKTIGGTSEAVINAPADVQYTILNIGGPR